MPKTKTKKPVRLSSAERKRCFSIFEKLSALVDGDLPDEVCRQVEAHFNGCPNCVAFYNTFKATVGLCQDDPPRTIPRAARERIAKQIRQMSKSDKRPRR